MLLGLITLLDLVVVGWSIDVPAEYRSARELLNPPWRAEWLRYVQGAGRRAQGAGGNHDAGGPHVGGLGPVDLLRDGGRSRLWVVTSREHGVPGEYVDPLGRGVADTNILLGLTSLTDYGPLQPVRFVRHFDFKPWGEALRAREQLERSNWMPLFNIGWVLLCDPDLPPPATGRLVTTTSRGYRLYRIDAPLGEAYVEPPTLRQAVRVERLSPQRVRVVADWGHVSDEATKRRSDEGETIRHEGTKARRHEGSARESLVPVASGLRARRASDLIERRSDEGDRAEGTKARRHEGTKGSDEATERRNDEGETIRHEGTEARREQGQGTRGKGQGTRAAHPGRTSPPSHIPARTAGRLVLARLAVRGWRATVDGQPVPLSVAYGCLLAVPLGQPGPHTVELWYRPPGLVAGLWVTALSMVVVVACALVKSGEPGKK